MNTLTFKDSTVIELTSTSSENNIEMILESFSELDSLRALFTESNLKGAVLHLDTEDIDIHLHNIVPSTLQIEADYDGSILVHFGLREKTHDEIVDEQLSEIQLVIAEMMA